MITLHFSSPPSLAVGYEGVVDNWSGEEVKETLLKLINPPHEPNHYIERAKLLSLVASRQFGQSLSANWPEFDVYPAYFMDDGFVSVGRVLTELTRNLKLVRPVFNKENWPKTADFGPLYEGLGLTTLTILKPLLVDVGDAHFQITVEGSTSGGESLRVSVSGVYNSPAVLYLSRLVRGTWVETPYQDPELLVRTFAKFVELSLAE